MKKLLSAGTTRKISEMTPAGDSKSTDLFEISRSNGSGGYDTFSCTAQQIIDSGFPPEGRYSPVITLIQGLFSVSVVIDTDGTTELADYSANSAQPSGFITCRITFNIATDGSVVQRRFRFSPPISSNFTTVGQARICGLPSIVKNPGTEGNTACGWNGNLTSDPTTKDILFSFETSELLTTYYIDLSFRYEKLA